MAPSPEILKENNTPPAQQLHKCMLIVSLKEYCFNTYKCRDVSQQLYLLLRKLLLSFGKQMS